MDKESRSRSSTRLPAASSGGQLPSRFRSSSRQNGSRRAPSMDAQSRFADPNQYADRMSKLHHPVRAPSPGTRSRVQQHLTPHKHHLVQQQKQASSRIPVRTPTPPPRLPTSASMPEPASRTNHSQLPRTHSHTPAAQASPARPPHAPLLPRMFSPSDPAQGYLQGNQGLHERGLQALKEYRRLRAERMQQALRSRQQQAVPQGSNGHLKYTIQQPPFLAGRPRTSSQPPNHHQLTPTRSGSRGRSGHSQSPASAIASRTPFAADRPLTSRRGSSVCSERRGFVSAQRSGSGTASTPPATPPDIHAAVSAAPSPALQVARGPVLKITPKVTPKLRTRTNGAATDSQMHAEASLLRPQSPPSLQLQDQYTESTHVSSNGPTEGGAGGMDGGMEDLLLQQVTALLQEKSNWTSEKQRLEKEVEQLHELVEYLFEQFNVPMDDSSVPLDELTGLPQYLPGSDSHLPADSAQFAASAELPPSFGGSFSSNAVDSAQHARSAQLPPVHNYTNNGMSSASNGNVMHYNSADLPPVHRGDPASGVDQDSGNRSSKQQQHRQHHSASVLSHSSMEEQCVFGGRGEASSGVGGPVAESDASFINMLCEGMTMMSASEAPHAGNMTAQTSESPKAFPLVVDGAGGGRR